SRQGARLPPAHAHPCRPCDPERSSSQGPHRAFRVTAVRGGLPFVLARVHRLVRADDYRQTVRRGRKVAATNTISYVIDRGDGNPVRFGFIVSKAVGNAVTRNRVRRRLKAASYEVLARTRPGLDIVVRALPASDRASWVTLRNEIFGLVDRLEVSR